MQKQITCQITKRRGRPQKKIQQNQSLDQFFSIHDNVFHAAVLFYTYHIFDKTPIRLKFNLTIGFSLYEKLKQLTATQRSYYKHDQYAIECSRKYQGNQNLVNFFINSMTFGPTCVIDEFYSLFIYILDQSQQPSVSNCLEYMKNKQFKFINFNCSILDLLQVRSTDKRKMISIVISQELNKFVQIIIHTLWALKKNCKQNAYDGILQSSQELFERRNHNKGRKLIKV